MKLIHPPIRLTPPHPTTLPQQMILPPMTSAHWMQNWMQNWRSPPVSHLV
jgi:hypothetical protein